MAGSRLGEAERLNIILLFIITPRRRAVDVDLELFYGEFYG